MKYAHNVFLAFLLGGFIFCGCHGKKHRGFSANGTTTFYLDESDVNNFFQHHTDLKSYQEQVQSFYSKHDDQYVWINSGGVNPRVSYLMNMLRQDSIALNTPARSQMKLEPLLQSLKSKKRQTEDSLTSELELLLTASFFDYAKRNWMGVNKQYSNQAEWFIERKKINYESELDSLLKTDSAIKEPVYAQYGLLKKYLGIYSSIKRTGGWPDWTHGVSKLKRGDTAEVIPLVKKQLSLVGDLTQKDSSKIFNEVMETAVRKFQTRHGLMADGIITGGTLKEFAIPVGKRIEEILLNMERCRWVPINLKGDYLSVNIPEFKLHVFHGDTLVRDFNVVVGKQTNTTVIFNDNLEYIVFSPSWHIPEDIVNEETLPEIQKNKNYLAAHNMEVTDKSGHEIDPNSINWNKYSDGDFPYAIRQRPGEDNSLGKVKFLFPNSYGIYLHDTPAKSLFEETKRAFSHGCIRVEEPARLAEYLLRDDNNWTAEKIQEVMDSGVETTVKLKTKVPVIIGYFTAWVDHYGRLNFRDDIYGHDEKMAELLF